MPQITQYLNPFKTGDVVHEEVRAGSTIQQWFEQRGEFVLPTVCYLNGDPILRDAWVHELSQDDTVIFQSLPAGLDPISLAIGAAVALAASFAVIALLPKPETDSSGFEQSPTYNLEAQSNRARLYQPIPDHYGRVRLYPDLAAQPFREFGANNQQILYQLFLVGHGEYEYETLKVEDTDVTNFAEISTEFIEPGGQVTLFPDNVESSVEVGGIDLDDQSYKGPFIANQTGTEADALAFDFVAPRGVYYTKSSGSFRRWTNLVIEMQAREVDALGDPVGAGTWTTLGTKTVTSANRDVVRQTHRFSVTPGRYEARVKRVNVKETDTRVQNEIEWSGLKAYITGDQNYGDVSLIAVRANATNDLSAKSQFRFNIVATRKLPTWDGSTWTAPVATRDIAPAVRAMLTAGHGGNKTADEIDLDRLQALDAIWKARSDEFNYRYDRLGNLWKNLGLLLRTGRSAPNLDGSLVSFTRHQAQTLPVTLFTPENIVAGSFSINDSFPDEETEDHVIVEYFDKTTWRMEQVVCVLSGATQLRPKTIQLAGIVDRQQAYNEGIYESAKLQRMSTTVKFTTELEGLVPQFMDLIAIGHDLPGWAQSGELLEVSGTTYTLSQDADFSAGGNHYIGFRKSNGSLAGPFLATAGAAPNEVVVTDSLGFTPYTDGGQVRTLYQFGPSSTFEAQAVVVDVAPTGERVTITALLEVDSVHDAAGTAPALTYTHALEADPVAPVVTGLVVLESEVDYSTAIATWNQAPGAEVYLLEKSTDGGTTWQPVGRTSGTRQPIVLESGQFLLRVAGRGAIRGPWLQATVQLTAKPRTDYTAELYYQELAPTDPDLDIGDIWIKILDATGQATAGYQYLEQAPTAWADPAVPEYEWVIDDTNHTVIVSLINAHNAQRAASSALANAAAAIIAAGAAQTTANSAVSGAHTTFFQNDPPTVNLNDGDLWVDGDANNALYRYNLAGSSWVLIQDSQTALTTANLAQATADGKIKTYRQTTPPTPAGVGDFWIDSDDLDKLYRWNSTVWVSVQDGTIFNAQQAADAAQVDATQALQDAADLALVAAGIDTRVDDKIQTFWQASPPTAEGVGDLWIDTDDQNFSYRWSGTGWDPVQDQRIPAAILAASGAQATADGKVALYYSDSTSPPESAALGDIWSQDDTGLVLRWNGTTWSDTIATVGAPPGTAVNNVPVSLVTDPPPNMVLDTKFEHDKTYWLYGSTSFRTGKGQQIPTYITPLDGLKGTPISALISVKKDYWFELESDANNFAVGIRILLQLYVSGNIQISINWYQADKTTLVLTEAVTTITADVFDTLVNHTAAAKVGAKWGQVVIALNSLVYQNTSVGVLRITDVGVYFTGESFLPAPQSSGGTANRPIVSTVAPVDETDGGEDDTFTNTDAGLQYTKINGVWVVTGSIGAPDSTPIGPANQDAVLDLAPAATANFIVDPYFAKSKERGLDTYWRSN